MDRVQALATFDRERRELDVGGFVRHATPQLVRHVPMPEGAGRDGFVSFSQHSADTIEPVIDEVIAIYCELGCDFEWKVFEHDMPSDLVSRLRARGLAIGEAEELVVLPLADADALLGAAINHRVQRVTTPKQLSDYLAIAGIVWRGAEHAEWLEQELRERPEETALYVAYVGDQPAASARASFTSASRFAGLWTGATLPTHRGRGLYTDLVRARAREAASRGYEYLMVDALPTSRPILSRLGFERMSASHPCRWTPAAR
jgi:GNAT superfamily N-acetyltransferase